MALCVSILDFKKQKIEMNETMQYVHGRKFHFGNVTLKFPISWTIF